VDGLAKDLGIPYERFIAAEDGTVIVHNGLKISGIAAAHEFLDRNPQTGQYPYMGYVIEGNGISAYHSGDCCIYEGLLGKLQKWERIDAAFLPINGRDAKRYSRNCIGNMTYQEAVDLAGELHPKMVIPVHYDMFKGNLEDPSLFADYLAVKYPSQSYWIGEPGTENIL
jgi:L-ascorbate metabolism protein UlaG (beta-lactamase superfamily)